MKIVAKKSIPLTEEEKTARIKTLAGWANFESKRVLEKPIKECFEKDIFVRAMIQCDIPSIIAYKVIKGVLNKAYSSTIWSIYCGKNSIVSMDDLKNIALAELWRIKDELLSFDSFRNELEIFCTYSDGHTKNDLLQSLFRETEKSLFPVYRAVNRAIYQQRTINRHETNSNYAITGEYDEKTDTVKDYAIIYGQNVKALSEVVDYDRLLESVLFNDMIVSIKNAFHDGLMTEKMYKRYLSIISARLQGYTIQETAIYLGLSIDKVKHGLVSIKKLYHGNDNNCTHAFFETNVETVSDRIHKLKAYGTHKARFSNAKPSNGGFYSPVSIPEKFTTYVCYILVFDEIKNEWKCAECNELGTNEEVTEYMNAKKQAYHGKKCVIGFSENHAFSPEKAMEVSHPVFPVRHYTFHRTYAIVDGCRYGYVKK